MKKALINSDPFLVASLKTEIEVMNKLNSPHIVKLYEALETANNINMVLELCSDGDLDSLI